MSQPRQVVSGATYLVTRRIILRHMLLRPDKPMTQILLYLLAVAARRHGIEVHAVVAMSTHIHLIVTDVRGVLPAFLHSFHRTVALCTQVLRGWRDVVWDKQPTSVVRLETPAAMVEKIAYVLANPVAAGLVRRARDWPGAKVLVSQIGRDTLRIDRPDIYLDPKNPAWPEEATLSISLPPCIAPEQSEAFRAQVSAELARLEAAAHGHSQREGRGYLGAERAPLVSPEARAASAEPAVDHNPRFAVGREQGDAWRRAAAAARAFRVSYQAALDLWRAGIHGTVFPAGTWWMHVFHGASVADLATAGAG